MEKYINDFINLAIGSGGWMILDRIYLRNRLESLIGEWQKENEEVEMPESMSSQEIVDKLLNVAIKTTNLILKIKEILKNYNQN